jgi:hypothetical protein
MKTLIRIIVIPIFLVVAIIVAPFMLLRSSAFRRKRKPARPMTLEDIQKAERKLGFELPAELRSFFLDRPRMKQDCAERYTLDEAVKEYRMLTKSPYGPEGQDWPANLFPFADLLPGYACFDRDTGKIVIWDPEDLGEEDHRPDLWDKSFRPTRSSLAQWISKTR